MDAMDDGGMFQIGQTINTAVQPEDKLQIGLQYLPADIILNIVHLLFEDRKPRHPLGHGFGIWSTLLNFAFTSREIYSIATPEVYKLDARFARSSALLISARTGSLRAVRWSVVEGGASVNQEDHTAFFERHDGLRHTRGTTSGFTALHWATIFGHEDIVRFLLEQDGVDVDARAKGVSVDVGDRNNYRSHRRVDFHEKSIAKTLMDNNRSGYYSWPLGPAKNLGVNTLYFALDQRVQYWAMACPKHPTGFIPALRGADAPERRVDTSKVLTARKNIAKMLIQAGSSMRTHAFSYEPLGMHALHQAVSADNLDLVEFLVKRIGIDPQLTDPAGRDPGCYVSTWIPHRLNGFMMRSTDMFELLHRLSGDRAAGDTGSAGHIRP